MNEGYIRIEDYATDLNLSVDEVRKRIRNGSLAGELKEGGWYVDLRPKNPEPEAGDVVTNRTPATPADAPDPGNGNAGRPRIQAVSVVDFDMSFGSMVFFMVKAAIAAIPAVIILIVLGFVAFTFLGTIGSIVTPRL